MTKYQKYHKNYTELGHTYQLVLPLSFEVLVPEDDSVRLLSHKLEEPDYTLLCKAYSAKGRNPAVDPKTMFKIVPNVIHIRKGAPLHNCNSVILRHSLFTFL